MAFNIRFSEEKNELLRATRGISFEQILKHIKEGDLLADKSHANPAKSHQRIYVVRIGNYAYVVPYIINPSLNEIFLKTAYPSRKLTKEYITKGAYDEK